MLKLLLAAFFSLLALFFGGKKNLNEENFITIPENAKANLITHNGCWDINHFIINRGDSVLNIPATIGASVYGYTYSDSVIWADTLPTNYLVDFAFPEAWSQIGWNNSGTRFFTATTESYIYLYAATTTFYFDTLSIDRIDSIPAPPGFFKTAIHDIASSFLVVTRLSDSVNYAYTFYSLPSFAMDTQFVFGVKPDLLTDEGIIVGDSSGVKRLIHISPYNYQILFNIDLPSFTANAKEVSSDFSRYYFLSSPGDSVTNLIRLNKADTSYITAVILLASGVGASSVYGNQYFIFQPDTDTSVLQMDKNLLALNAYLLTIVDTIYLSKRIDNLHYNSVWTGWGPPSYSLIMTANSGLPAEQVYYYEDFGYSVFDSVTAGAAPTWFAEDFGCAIGIEEVEKRLSIDIFPNPAMDNVEVHIHGLAKGKTYNFTITDISGKLLWKKDVVAKEKYVIPLETFPSGILIFKLETGNKSISKKIVKL